VGGLRVVGRLDVLVDGEGNIKGWYTETLREVG
jgi:hypothetical protein